jgi:hypothetical protein
MYFIDDEDKSGEQPYLIEFMKRLSLSCLPQRTLNLKFNTIVIFFILQQLKTLQHYKFPIKIAFAKGQTLKLLEYIDHCLFFFPHGQLCVAFSRASSFDNVTVEIIEGRRRRTENDRLVTSIIGCREALESFKNADKFLLNKCFIFSTCELMARVQLLAAICFPKPFHYCCDIVLNVFK